MIRCLRFPGNLINRFVIGAGFVLVLLDNSGCSSPKMPADHGRITLRSNQGLYGPVFSPNGKLLASEGGDETIKLWNPENGEELATLHGVTRPVFSPNGKVLASVGRDGTVKLWNPDNGEELATLRGASELGQGLRFSPNGSLLASGNQDHSVILWDTATYNIVSTIALRQAIETVAFSPNGKTLALGASGRTLVFWDIQKQKKIGEIVFMGEEESIIGLKFSPDGNTLSVWIDQLTQLDMRKILPNIPKDLQPQGIKGAPSFKRGYLSPDGKTLAARGEHETLVLWDFDKEKPRVELVLNADWLNGFAFSPNGKILATGATLLTGGKQPGEVKLWDTTNGNELASFRAHFHGVWCVTFSPDGHTLATCGHEDFAAPHSIELWDVPKLLSGQVNGDNLK